MSFLPSIKCPGAGTLLRDILWSSYGDKSRLFPYKPTAKIRCAAVQSRFLSLGRKDFLLFFRKAAILKIHGVQNARLCHVVQGLKFM